jgi:hypothetical protein
MRRICLVLGAGASLDHAAKFRRGKKYQPPLDTTFFTKVAALKLQLTPALRSYIRTLTGAEPDLETLATYRMEEFFKDAYFDFRDRPNDRRALAAYTDLVVLYNRVLRETTNWLCDDGHPRGRLGRILVAAARAADEVSILTFNHDLLIENEIYKRPRLGRRWCIDYAYGSFGEGMTRLEGDDVASDFAPHSDNCQHDRPIRLFKLHGSLNWIVRIQGRQPTANDLSGEGRLKNVFLNVAREIEAPLIRQPGGGRGRKVWYTWPLVIPPIYAKQALINQMRETWDDARKAITRADRVVVYGYSLPQLDIEAEKLVQRGIVTNRNADWIDVVNPDPMSAQRYAGIAPTSSVRWYPSLSSFLALDDLTE